MHQLPLVHPDHLDRAVDLGGHRHPLDGLHGEIPGDLQLPWEERAAQKQRRHDEEPGRLSDPLGQSGQEPAGCGRLLAGDVNRENAEPREQEQTPHLVLLDQPSADAAHPDPDQSGREQEGRGPVSPVDPPFALREAARLVGRGKEPARQLLLEEAEGLRPQVGDLEIVAQQVVAVEADQGIEVEECLDPRPHEHDERHPADPGVDFRHSPGLDRHRPQA